MIIAIFIIILLVIFLMILKKNLEVKERFYPAWNNHIIYNQLSSRIKIGISRKWIRINNLQFVNKVLNLTNCEVRIYEDDTKLFEDLIYHKHIDLAITSEVDYGVYILSKLSKNLDIPELTKDTILKNKDMITKTFNTRRLFTMYPMYRVLLTNNVKINKPDDINNKIIQITSVSNEIYKLDLEILKKYQYRPIYKEDNEIKDKYHDIKTVISGKIDGYFTDFNNPDENLLFLSENTNMNLIDLYDKKKDSYQNILDKFFFIKKDTMDLRYYPKLYQRRKQIFDYKGISLNPKKLNCYTYKTFILTREDVPDEWIYLFTKKIYENLEFLVNHIPYFKSLNKHNIYNSSLDDLVPLHRALFKPK